LGQEGFRQVLKINRVDLDHVRKGDSLIVPLGSPESSESAGGSTPPAADPASTHPLRAPPAADSLRFSPFPLVLDGRAALPKLLLISIRVQAFAAYEQGKLVRWGPTSTGRKETPTPVGLFHTNWKDKERTSTVNEEWLLTWYVNLENRLGVSLHQYALPGRPASHSCIRLLEEDARWLYGWSEQWKLSADRRQVLEPGTPVLIFGSYAYGKQPPWKRLPDDPESASIPLAEIERALTEVRYPF
jgi:hypothetical protein